MEKIDNITAIPFEINNEGIGIAFSVDLKYLNTNESIVPISVAFKHNGKNRYNILGVREPVDKDVLRVGKQTDFCLYLAAIDENLCEITPSTDLKWDFDILFYDIQGREYSQTYSFYTSTRENKVFRVDSQMPQLIK